MTLTSAGAVEAVLARETDKVFCELLRLRHSTFNNTLYIANNTEPVVSNGNTYLSFPFNWTRPSENNDAPKGEIVMANVGRDIGARLEAASGMSPIEARAQIVLFSSPDTIEKEWDGLELRQVVANDILARGTLTQRQYARELWPPRRMTESHGFAWIGKL